MFSIWYPLYIFVIATIISFLEIQIEGKDGWAKNLPCWRPKRKWLLAKIYSWFIGGKEITGYHLALNTLEIAVFHLPFFAEVNWNIVKELQILSCFPLFWTFQDFTWFLFNPFYGLKKFNPQAIWWHKKWVGPVPTDYLIAVISSGIFVLLAIFFKGSEVFVWWIVTLVILLASTLISCVISYLFRLVRKSQE